MDKKLGYFILGVLLMLSPPLLALTDAEIEARLDQYAAKIKALEVELANAKKAPVYEQDLSKSSGKLEKQIQQIKDKMAAEEQRFKINGFLTAGVNMADDNVSGSYEIEDKPSFSGDSKVGLQVGAQINDRMDATVQLLARGRGAALGNPNDPWEISAEWAYLGYQINDALKVRAGRLRIPFYMTSETLDVGYSYPWVRPPTNMYTTAITAYDGVDVLYDFSTGSWNHKLQISAGSGASTNNTKGDADQELQVRADDVYTINLTSSYGDWTLRAMAAHLAIDGNSSVRTDTAIAPTEVDITYILEATLGLPPGSLPPGFLMSPGLDQTAAVNLARLAASGSQFTSCDLDFTGTYCTPGGYLNAEGDDTFYYYSLGGMYDNGSLLVMAEAAKLTSAATKLFPDIVAMYVTTGYRFGDWMPYVTYQHSYDTTDQATLSANNLNPRAQVDSTKSRMIGLRKELGVGMDLKVEWENKYDFESADDKAAYGDDLNIYTITLDAVF